MDQVARKPVIKQGRAHFPSLHLDRTLNIEITKGLYLIPCLALSLSSLCQGVRSAVILAWPSQGVYWPQFTRPLVTRDGCDPEETEEKLRWWWWCEEEMVQHHPDTWHSEEICTGNISHGFIYYWLIMKVTFVKSVLLFRDGPSASGDQRTRPELFVNPAVNTE